MPPWPSTFRTRYLPSQPSSPAAIGGERIAVRFERFPGSPVSGPGSEGVPALVVAGFAPDGVGVEACDTVWSGVADSAVPGGSEPEAGVRNERKVLNRAVTTGLSPWGSS